MAGSQHPPDDNDPEHIPTTHTTHSELNKIFRAVSHPERRHTLRVLDRTDDPQTVDELAATLAAEQMPGSLTDHDRLVTSLTHRHLPHLADVELIDRTNDDHVTATQATTNVVHLLDTALVTFD